MCPEGSYRNMTSPGRIKLEGRDVYPARVEGVADVYHAPKFVLVKARWVEDVAVSTCVLCDNKFNQLRRKHHCRTCGRVLCNKCCKERIPLPQLGIEDAERVCDSCCPIAELVTKARSQMQEFHMESAKGLAEKCGEHDSIKRVVELGGIQTLIVLGQIENIHVLRHVISGLHTLATHEPLHTELANAGVIKVLCSILSRTSEHEEQILSQGISALMIFCKSPNLKTKVLDDGALNPVLSLCTFESPAVSLLALRTLSLIAEHPDTHNAIVENSEKALPRILSLTTSVDEQTQEVALKTLAHLSNGSDSHRHRIVQEDFSSDRSLHKAIRSRPRNEQILCNAMCLIANLASGAENQNCLREVVTSVCEVLQNSTSSTDLKLHLSRAVANFAKFKQNADRLVTYIPDIVQVCVKSQVVNIRMHGMRAILSLLTFLPTQTTSELMRDGAVDLLEELGRVSGLVDSMQTSLMAKAGALARPL